MAPVYAVAILASVPVSAAKAGRHGDEWIKRDSVALI